MLNKIELSDKTLNWLKDLLANLICFSSPVFWIYIIVKISIAGIRDLRDIVTRKNKKSANKS